MITSLLISSSVFDACVTPKFFQECENETVLRTYRYPKGATYILSPSPSDRVTIFLEAGIRDSTAARLYSKSAGAYLLAQSTRILPVKLKIINFNFVSRFEHNEAPSSFSCQNFPLFTSWVEKQETMRTFGTLFEY